MGKYVINGARSLVGDTVIQGSKNSALAILISSLVTEGDSLISNLPKINDVKVCIEILRMSGATVIYEDENTVRINTKNVGFCHIPSSITSKLRASSYLLGALTARAGSCAVPESGGCNFGTRPIDLHVYALEKLGATENNGLIEAKNGLKGARINFPIKTVGATINAVIAATKANGVTVIENAAREPHVKELCKYLIGCGAEIIGGGTDKITVRGRSKLHGCAHTIGADMIEAGTYACFALATGGKIRFAYPEIRELSSFFDTIRSIGANVEYDSCKVTVSSNKILSTDIVTAPFPFFPTDLQPQITALLGIADGNSKITEAVFKTRFGYLKELSKFGLNFEMNDNTVTVHGIKEYSSANAKATDLRGGAAVLLCALNAKGTSVIDEAEIVERGYSHICLKLCQLGADIAKI